MEIEHLKNLLFDYFVFWIAQDATHTSYYDPTCIKYLLFIPYDFLIRSSYADSSTVVC